MHTSMVICVTRLAASRELERLFGREDVEHFSASCRATALGRRCHNVTWPDGLRWVSA